MQDKKLKSALKSYKQEILESLLAEHNGLLILRHADSTQEMMKQLVTNQNRMQQQVSASNLTLQLNDRASLDQKLDLFMQKMEARMDAIQAQLQPKADLQKTT
jgi:hypothetical protein